MYFVGKESFKRIILPVIRLAQRKRKIKNKIANYNQGKLVLGMKQRENKRTTCKNNNLLLLFIHDNLFFFMLITSLVYVAFSAFSELSTGGNVLTSTVPTFSIQKFNR